MDRGASQIEGTVCLKDLSWKKYGMLENGKDQSDKIRLEEWARNHIMWDHIDHNDFHLYPKGYRSYFLKSFKQSYGIHDFIESKTSLIVWHSNFREVKNRKNCISKN